MEWISLLKAIALCLVSIFIEALSATKTGRLWFEQLKRPKYSFPMRIWYIVGAVYYIIFGIITYRQFSASSNIFSVPIVLLVLVMLINGISNFIIFKYHSIKWFYFIVYPFGLLLLALIIVLAPADKLSAALAFIYFLWLIYDLYYGYNLWKLNPWLFTQDNH